MESGALNMTIDNCDLGLREAAQARFAFLEKSGFSCVSASSSKVRYESDKVYIEVGNSERGGEVAISFGRLAKKEEFSFTLYLQLMNPDLERSLGARLPENQTQLNNDLTGLAAALELEGQPIIRGNDAIFDRMREVRWWHFRPEALKGRNRH